MSKVSKIKIPTAGGVTQVFAFGEDTLRSAPEKRAFRSSSAVCELACFAHKLASMSKVSKTKIPTAGVGIFILEASPRFELGVEVLQTFALPLGYDAVFICALIL